MKNKLQPSFFKDHSIPIEDDIILQKFYFGSTILKVSKTIATVQTIPRIVDIIAEQTPAIFQIIFGCCLANRTPG